MKTKNAFTGFVTMAVFLTFLLISCERNNQDAFSSADLELAEDEAFSDAVFEDLMNEIDAAETSGTFKSTSEDCGIVSMEQSDTVVTITIDFGDGCEQVIQNRFGVPVDTIMRKGKIFIHRYGNYRQQGSYRMVTLNGYSVNGIQIEGTRTITNMGLDQNLHTWFALSLQNGKITTPDGIVITRTSERERHWVAGEDTELNPWDDEYRIMGTVEGVTGNGESYMHTIADSLQVRLACRFIVGGQIEFVFGNREPVVLDYGIGECDDIATLNRNGNTREIALRFRTRPMWRRVLRYGQQN